MVKQKLLVSAVAATLLTAAFCAPYTTTTA